MIDTGIDYTHANFGGPGTVEAYEAADAADTTLGPEDAPWFGPTAPKVKGGIDLVGDAYDGGADPGSPALIPHPDPDPLDCPFTNGSVGHGSHVSGTATGFGVLADGSTYDGPYNSSTPSNAFTVGPGVAPEADLYFIRVFGCDGSTEVTTEAIDWAVDHDMDVINMSLGSPFGRVDDPSAVAATNAAAAGVSVVTSAGNSGPAQYITGSPGTGSGSIATAAIDSNASFGGVSLDLTPGDAIDAISANGIRPADGTTYEVVVVANNPATPENEALGCSAAAYTQAGVAPGPNNLLAVVERGTCARVAKAIFGQMAGADAVVMINNAASFPPFEGPILYNPDTGVESRSPSRSWASSARRTVHRQPPCGPPTRRQDGQDPGQPGLPRLRQLQLGRPAQWRQRPQAGHRGAGRQHPLHRGGERQQGPGALGHLDGLAARRGCGGAGAPGPSDLDPRGGQGGHRQHRQSRGDGRLPRDSRGQRPGVAGRGDLDQCRCAR